MRRQDTYPLLASVLAPCPIPETRQTRHPQQRLRLAPATPAAYSGGMARHAPHRILLNLLLDSLIAALALPVAMLLATPASWPPETWWYGAVPGAMAALLAAGLPVRLPQQYWRYAGLKDLLGIGGA